MQMTVLRHAILLRRSHLDGDLANEEGLWVEKLVVDGVVTSRTPAEQRKDTLG